MPLELPSWVEEILLKPLVWLGPVVLVVFRFEKKNFASLGFTTKNLYRSLLWGFGLGMLFAFEGFWANWLKYGRVNLSSFGYDQTGFLFILGISFVSALVEETVFRGYFFTRLRRLLKRDWSAIVLSALLFALIYLPVSVFVLGYEPVSLLVYLFFIFIYGLGAAAVFNLSGNLASSILLHFLWSWPILLFR